MFKANISPWSLTLTLTNQISESLSIAPITHLVISYPCRRRSLNVIL